MRRFVPVPTGVPRGRRAILGVLLVGAVAGPASGQAGGTTAPAEIRCPAALGEGVQSGASYCDVLSGTDPSAGVVVVLPPHRGEVTLSFDLHNRHTYSDEQVRANRAYARYTAVIAVVTADGTVLRRAAIQSEFRQASDLVERIGGGAGPTGVKAVAPVGSERIVTTIPAAAESVSLLGEQLVVERFDAASTYSAPGRPIAMVSHVTVEYRPGRTGR